MMMSRRQRLTLSRRRSTLRRKSYASRQVVSRLPLRMMAVAAVVVAAIVVMVFARQGQGRSDTPQPVAQPRTESAAPPAPVVPETPTPIPLPAPESPVTSAPRRESANADASVTVLKAQLCSGSREDRLARLAVRARERRTPAGDLYVLHAAADHFRDEGRTSVVPRRPRASDDAAARERESRQRLSDVQRDDGQPRTGWRVESRAARRRWNPSRSKRASRALMAVERLTISATRPRGYP